MADELEERTVEVNLPTLSADANQRLTQALREVIGADRVQVPSDRPRPSQGDRPKRGPLDRMTTVKAIVLGVLAVAACLALIILTWAGGHWVVTGLAFLVLLAALALVTYSIIALSSVPEYPDPGLVALLAEEGIHDPEVRFSEIVMEFTPETGDDEERPTDVQDDPARAIAEQQGALTASSGPTRSGADTKDD